MRFVINQNCVSCLACVRVCPAQAIAVQDTTVRIVEGSCIRAGACLPACPHSAIDAVGEFADARALASGGEAVLILSVEAEVYFYPQAPEQVVNACYAVGFRGVERGVLGDELVAGAYNQLFADPGWGTLIRSTCPVIVEQIKQRYPELVPFLAPIKTPLAAEAEYLRSLYGDEVPLVYAGVCVAGTERHVDALVTFEELKELFRVNGVEVAAQPQVFSRLPSVRTRHVSTSGGMPFPVLQSERHTSRRFRKVRGLDSLAALARAVVEDVDLGFVDILPCEGCLDHPLLGPSEELFHRRRIAEEAEPPRSRAPVIDDAVPVDVERAFAIAPNGRTPPQQAIDSVIADIGTIEGAHWDCGACGYQTCVEFATAFLNGRATLRLCPPFQERQAREAHRLAAVDDLTGLATQRVLRDRLTEEVARSGRSQEPFGVLFIDLDRFKRVNDTVGHPAGSKLLSAVGHALRQVIRKTDVAARYGGDEFVVVLVRTDLDGARRVGEVIRESMEGLGKELGYTPETVSVSIGVASYDPRLAMQPDVLEAADQALYRAKDEGGNRVVMAGQSERLGTARGSRRDTR